MIVTPLGTLLDSSERTFAFQRGKTYSYSDLYQRCSYYASIISESTTSFLIGANNVDTIAFYLACLSRKSPIILLPNTIRHHALNDLLSAYRPAQVFDARDKRARFDGFSPYNEFLDICNDISYLDNSQELPALLLPTSGSTGSRKLVKVSHKNLRSNTKSIIDYLCLSSDSVHICSLPFTYTFGLSCINTHLSVSASLVLNDYSIIDNCFWELVDLHKPTTFSGVPYTYQVLSRFKTHFLASLPFKKYTQAGGKLSSDLTKLFHKIASTNEGEFIVMYGQTEATARMSYLPSSYLPDKAGSIGIPIPGGRFTIEYISDLPKVSDYCQGELLYYGPNVTHGYSSTVDDIYIKGKPPSCLRTGDIAYVDNDGLYYITGRLSRFAKINGIRISLDEIESSINKTDVILVSDDNNIFVFYCPPVTKEDLLLKLELSTSLPSRVFRFIQLDSVPRNESGKVIYAELYSKISN